jgi:hypothetical protein
MTDPSSFMNYQVAIVLGSALMFAVSAIFSRHVPSIAGAGILAGVAILAYLAPNSTPTVIAVGCAAGSVLTLWIGRRICRDRRALQRDLRSLSDKIAVIASQNTLADIRTAELNLLREQTSGARGESQKNGVPEETHDAELVPVVPRQADPSDELPVK